MSTKPSDIYRGHPIYRDEANCWRYSTGELVSDCPKKHCGYCGLPDTPEGHDGCLGTLPGVINACCGHGESRGAYVEFADGKRLSGKDAMSYFDDELIDYQIAEADWCYECNMPRGLGDCDGCFACAPLMEEPEG